MASNLSQATTDVNRLHELVAFFNQICLGGASEDATLDNQTRPVLAKLAASFLLGMDTYATVAEGLAGAGEGGFFQVVSDVDEEYTILYQDVNGVAIEKKRYPSWQMVALIFQARDRAEAAAAESDQSAFQAGLSRIQAHQSAQDARLASEASGAVRFYDTKALADAAILEEGEIVEVFSDESRGWRVSRYRYESGALVFKYSPKQDKEIAVNYNRPPLLSDFAGFSNGDLWRYKGKIWIANRVYPGSQASWDLSREGVEGVGNVNNLEGAYWLHKIISGYSGPAIQIQNKANGSLTDIGFNADGMLDADLLNDKLVNTRGRITTWYDQTGNGHHLTASGDARPVITKVDEIGGMPSIVFEKPIIYNNLESPSQFLTIPSTMVGASDAFSIVSLVKFASGVRNAPLVELSNDDGTVNAVGYREQNGVDCVTAYVNGSIRRLSGYHPGGGEEFLCLSSSTSRVKLYENDAGNTNAEEHSAAPSRPCTGGQVGASASQFKLADGTPVSGGFSMSGLLIAKRGLVDTEVRRIYRATVKRFELVPQVRGNLVFDGDSITEGAFASQFNSWPKMAGDLLPNRFTFYNVAKGGGTLPSQVSALSKWRDAIYDANDRFNTVVIFAGTNDINSGDTASTVFSNLRTYVDDVKGVGYSVVVATALPRQGFSSDGREAERLAYNEMIRDSWNGPLGAIALIDFANERTMGDASLVGDTTYYEDGTHPTDFGYSLLATYAAEVINRIV